MYLLIEGKYLFQPKALPGRRGYARYLDIHLCDVTPYGRGLPIIEHVIRIILNPNFIIDEILHKKSQVSSN